MIKIGTDFSGIGSPEVALKNLGIEIEHVFACDVDEYAKKSFLEIHKPKIFFDDITKRNHGSVEQLDMYFAGFPCQTFSSAGKRKGFDDVRGTLFFDTAEFIRINRPKVFVLENVKGLLNHDKGNTYQTIIDVLSNGGGTVNGQMSFDMFEDGLGYHLHTCLLNTKDFGLPQNRERIFIVGFDKFAEFKIPKGFELKTKLGDILQDNPNNFKLIDGFNSFEKIKYVNNEICGTITQHQSRSGITNGFKIEIENIKKYILSDAAIDCLNKHQKFNKFEILNNDSICKTLTAGCGKIQNNNNFIEVPEKYYLKQKQIDKLIQFNGELSDVVAHSLFPRSSKTGKGGSGSLSKTDGTAYCIDAQNTQAIEIKNTRRIRRLTPFECWKLQGFSKEDFDKAANVCSDTQLYKQAGNSISVPVIQAIIKNIKDALDK